MIGLTPRQRDVLAYLQDREFCPSYREIMKGTRAGMGVVQDALRGLEERGYVRRLPNRARAIEVLRRLPPRSVIINGQRYKFIPLERVEG